MSARIRLYLMFSIFMVLLLNLNGKAASLTPPSDGTDAFGGQDGFGYSWADNNETFGPAYRWIDISSNGTGISSRAIDLGFNFPYYGYTYRYAKVNEHGFITLDTLSTGVDHRYEIPSPEFPNRLICVLYDEDHMNASGGFMLYRLIHPDSLVIQWRVRKMASVTMVNFQAILTSNGNIVFQYQNVAPDNSTNAIGIENHLGTVGLQITNGAPFATAGKAIRITYPAVSVRAPTPYCWARNVAVTTHISWVAGDSAATFDLYFSNDSVAVDSRNPSALVGENMSVCSYVPPTALQEGAMFFWRVIVHGANGRIVAFPTWSFSTTGAPMTGTRTVGGLAPDFPSVIDAVAMVKQLGVGPGGVTFLIRPGRYYGQIVVTEIPGASQTNQVVFRAEQDTVLAYCQGVAIGNTNSVIKFHGCDWVTFDGICVADSISLNYRYNAYGYHITNNGTTNGATHNTIKNATISLEKSHALTRGVSITYNGTVSAQTAANSFNRLENLKIYCSVTGVYLGGHSTYRDSCNEVVSTTSDLSDQQRFLINYDSLGTNPEAAAAAGLGVYAANQTNLTIRNIDITGANGSIRTYGIQTTGLWGTNTISGNRIFRNQAMSTTTLDSSYGIRVAGGNNAVFYLNNNMIYQLTADTRSLSPTTAICLSGIYASGSSFTTYIDNNSLLLDQGLVDPADLIYSSAAICLNGGTHFVRNNIVSNQTTSQSGVSSHYGLYLASGTLTANNNCYFIPFGGNGFVGYNGTNRPNLSNWQGAGYDLAGQSGNPGFVLSTIPYDLHIQPASVSLVSNLGMPLPNVETDIEGDARDMSSPDIGADEGDFILASVPEAPQLLFPSNGATAVPVNSSLQWSNGINTDNVDVYISNSQVAVQTLSDSVRVVQASTSSSFTPPLEFIGGVTYYWRVAARNLSSGIVTVSNPASFTTFLPPVGGFKTIGGAAPDYPSFSTAIHDLQLGGVGQGGVVFRVRPGVYVERIVVPDIANASSENRIVFVKETDSVWVTSQGGPGTNDAMITLAGSKWVTFDGINIRCDTTTYYSNEIEWAYFVTNLSGTNGARNNTIQNCAIRMTSTYYAACAIRQTASSVSSNSGSNSYNRYLNLKISKCNYGLYVTGDTAFPDSSTVFGSTEAGVTFAGRTVIGAEGGNDIGGGDVYGVYCNGGQANLTIHDIDVCNTYVRQESANGPSYGIYATNLRGRSQIHGNHLYNIQNTTGDLAGRLYGAYISAYSANDSLLFYNNFIDSLEQSRNIPNYILMLYGVYVPASTGKVFVDNNTILMNPANNGVTNSCITQEGGIVYARNNILYNRCADQPNASHYCLYKSAGTLISDYNLFYVPNAEHGYIGYATSAYASLSNWQSATGQDVHSSFGDPRLVSDNSLPNLHIQLGVATPASNAGTPIP
ncbi:MAG: hypothetical protein OEM52_07180 [bacterium]|nr:hypothetical protein [bacterium]